MILENLQVKHKTFGLGTVVSMQGKYITVKFDAAEKCFVYPDSFEKFLTLADGTVSQEILSDLAVSQAHKQQIIAKKNEENIYSMTHGIVIPGKEMSSEVDEDERNYKNTETEEA